MSGSQVPPVPGTQVEEARMPVGSPRADGADGEEPAAPPRPSPSAAGPTDRVARLVDSMPAACFSLDRDWRFAYVNRYAERLLARRREQLLGGALWDLLPLPRTPQLESHLDAAMRSGRPSPVEVYCPPPLDAWYEVQAWSDPEGLSVHLLDITARRAARELAERAAERAHLLARVTSELTNTLDAEEAVARLAQLVVPTLADWCLVTLVEVHENLRSRSGLRDVGWAHSDPRMRPLVERYARVRWPALTESAYVLRARRTGEAVEVRSEATEAIHAVQVPGEAYDLISRLAPEAFAVLPLRGRGRTVGLLTLFNGAGRGAIPEADLTSAREVAGRAGLALDSGRLYRQQRDLAEGLQRSLLTAPPEPEHVTIAVRYTPAAEAAQVGGDWYDAFLQPDGATMLVIGDVIGHDTAAAAAMGQVRTMLRTLAAHTGLGPADVLRGVDGVMETLRATVTATAVVARVESSADEPCHGGTVLRWSNAGHPPPMVVNPDGSVVVLSAAEPDLLLGIDPSSQRVESTVGIECGATVLLFTDGLVERRGRSIDDGLSQLREAVQRLAAQDLSLDELCDAVLARMLPARREDDVALVAVRVHPDAGSPGSAPAGHLEKPAVRPLSS